MDVIKAHAYGNDFLFVPEGQAAGRERAELARSLCDRHRGIGADGLVFYRLTPRGATMMLLNADGSPSEVSGNGVRCLAAIVAHMGAMEHEIVIETGAGEKVLTPLARAGRRYTFRAAMGPPTDLRTMDLEAAGERMRVVAMGIGNPQCVVLGPPLTEARLHVLGAALVGHPAFPAGTNVELAEVENSDRVRILIWERGVGPTRSSGTGSCAAAVAAAAYGGAGRDVEVVAPGGPQRVEWREEGLYLTGWAEVVLEGRWLG